jgi:hypothetical protein
MNKLNNEELKELGNKILKSSQKSFNDRFGTKDAVTVKEAVGYWVEELLPKSGIIYDALVDDIKKENESTSNK